MGIEPTTADYLNLMAAAWGCDTPLRADTVAHVERCIDAGQVLPNTPPLAANLARSWPHRWGYVSHHPHASDDSRVWCPEQLAYVATEHACNVA